MHWRHGTLSFDSFMAHHWNAELHLSHTHTHSKHPFVRSKWHMAIEIEIYIHVSCSLFFRYVFVCWRRQSKKASSHIFEAEVTCWWLCSTCSPVCCVNIRTIVRTSCSVHSVMQMNLIKSTRQLYYELPQKTQSKLIKMRCWKWNRHIPASISSNVIFIYWFPTEMTKCKWMSDIR